MFSRPKSRWHCRAARLCVSGLGRFRLAGLRQLLVPVLFLAFLLALAAPVAGPLQATTLQQMTLAEMIAQSTAIVRARVGDVQSGLRGRDVFTYYRLEILETLKASTVPNMGALVAVPGGTLRGGRLGGIQQNVAGAPALQPGAEYVFFLWTSRSGLTQVIGLSQGLFQVQRGVDGAAVLSREAATELMLDAEGHVVEDRAIRMDLPELRHRVAEAGSEAPSGGAR